MITRWALLQLLIGLPLLAGCTGAFAPPAPPFQIDSYQVPAEEMSRVNHVVFVDLQLGEQDTPVAEDFNMALVRALQDQRFTQIDRVARTAELSELLPAEAKKLSLEQLSGVRKLTGGDAVIYGTITRFMAYPRMQVGLRLRMFDLRRGRMLWAVDHVWDSTDRSVERRIEEFFKTDVRPGYEPMQSQLALVSPKVFARFVAREVAATLPPR